jgi:BirA family biotin operon repressor/biotin-[acetyl-CoA-carboxylase] ligase
MRIVRRTVAQWDGISRAALKERWRREEVYPYGCIDSTNEAARDLAGKGVPAGTVVVCREQSAGKGRAGRAWHSPRDAGVYLSMIFRPQEVAGLAPLSILAGFGVVQRLDQAFPGLQPRLKWPNDVMANDRKLGGVLAEAVWSHAAPRHVVVGVGINVRPVRPQAPAAVQRTATAVDAILDSRIDLVEVADAVIGGLEAYMGEPPAELPAVLLEEVDRYDWLRDRRALVTPPGEQNGAVGVCVGIAPDGALLFRPDRGALRRVQDATVEGVE